MTEPKIYFKMNEWNFERVLKVYHTVIESRLESQSGSALKTLSPDIHFNRFEVMTSTEVQRSLFYTQNYSVAPSSEIRKTTAIRETTA